jgi:carbon-monoxide dehydrogenase small subunit
MRDIAVAADLSPANLYHYFRGKDEILFFCQDRSLDRLLAALAAAQRDARRPLPDRLRELAVRHTLCLIAEVEGSAAHFEVDALPAKRRAVIVAKRDRYERGVRALVASGIARRTLAARDATVATAFSARVNWTAQWFRPDVRFLEAVAEHIADFAIAGLMPHAHATRAHHADRQRRTDRRSRSRPTKRSSMLREDLNLCGTKHGCELGSAARAPSCSTISRCSRARVGLECDARRVTTVEGLVSDGALHPLQETFADLGAAQCGYCTPGILVTAKALLDEHPHPTRDQIRDALSGNLCRCTGYQQIFEAVEAAIADQRRPVLDTREHGACGSSEREGASEASGGGAPRAVKSVASASGAGPRAE